MKQPRIHIQTVNSLAELAKQKPWSFEKQNMITVYTRPYAKAHEDSFDEMRVFLIIKSESEKE